MITAVFIVMIVAVALLVGIYLGYFGETRWLFWIGALVFGIFTLMVREINVLGSLAFMVIAMVVTMKIKQAEEGK